MAQQGQVFPLAGRGGDGALWAYRYRLGGRGSKRVQRGGFDSERAAAEPLERLLEQLRRDHAIRLLDTYTFRGTQLRGGPSAAPQRYCFVPTRLNAPGP